MARRDARIDRIEDALGALGPIEARAMFGGFGIYIDGAMLGLVADGVLYLKVDDVNRADFARAGLEAFSHQGPRGVVTDVVPPCTRADRRLGAARALCARRARGRPPRARRPGVAAPTRPVRRAAG